MSLTRAEWEEMWWAIKRLETRLVRIRRTVKLNGVIMREHDTDVQLIKDKIEQVIGQMEVIHEMCRVDAPGSRLHAA